MTQSLSYKVPFNGRLWNHIQVERKLFSSIHQRQLLRFDKPKMGLFQGSVLSPMLLNIMIYDFLQFLSSFISDLECLLYADDLLVYVTRSDIASLESKLNFALNY